MGVHAGGGAGPACGRGRRARHRAGDERHPAQDHGTARSERHRQEHRKGRVHRRSRHCRPRGLQRQDEGTHHGAELAGAYREALQPEVYPGKADEQRTEDHRHAVPHSQGRHRRRTRSLRLGQDRRAAPAGDVVGRGHRLYRLRRARQRDDRRPYGVPRADRPEERRTSDEAHGAHSEHLRHARCGARGVNLYRHYHSGVLPRHGLRRGRPCRLDLPLGRGPA